MSTRFPLSKAYKVFIDRSVNFQFDNILNLYNLNNLMKQFKDNKQIRQ